MKKILLLLVASSFIIISACHSKKATQTTTTMNAPLTGTHWKITKVDGYDKPITDLQKDVYIQFDSSHRFSGTAGCNRMMGSYMASANTLNIGPAATTRMMCEPNMMELENAFTKMIEKVNAYTISGKKMQFKNGENVVAEFETE